MTPLSVLIDVVLRNRSEEPMLGSAGSGLYSDLISNSVTVRHPTVVEKLDGDLPLAYGARERTVRLASNSFTLSSSAVLWALAAQPTPGPKHRPGARGSAQCSS